MSHTDTRFRDIRPELARLLLAVLLALAVFGAAASPPPDAESTVVDSRGGDVALYRAVSGRVGEGEGYYEAVVSEQRARGYPLRPVLTVRLPTLAYVIGLLGDGNSAVLVKLLVLAAAAALALRLLTAVRSRALWGAAVLLGAGAMIMVHAHPSLLWWHESWAALLIVISCACRTEKRWAASVAFGLAALLVRELALPFLCLMAALAWRDGRKTEAAAWAAAIMLFFAAMAWHASTLATLVTPADRSSVGWAGMGGWSFIVQMAHQCTLFAVLPLPAAGMLLPLALLGWAGLRGSFGERAGLLLLGYAAAFMVFGRPDNLYWIILIAPWLPVGLAFAPIALRDLVAAALPARRPAVGTA